MAYVDDFKEAIIRTRRLQLAQPVDLCETHTRIMNDKRIRHLGGIIRPVLDLNSGYEQLVARCMPVHLQARPLVEEWLGCPVYFTLGWIDDGTPKGMFRFDDDFITDTLKNGYTGDTVNLHAWLTLPSMEIIDITLSTTISMLQGHKNQLGGVIIKRADDIKGFSYKPMLIGDEFLSKSGILHKFTYLELN